jgi:hypothetical protein
LKRVINEIDLNVFLEGVQETEFPMEFDESFSGQLLTESNKSKTPDEALKKIVDAISKIPFVGKKIAKPFQKKIDEIFGDLESNIKNLPKVKDEDEVDLSGDENKDKGVGLTQEEQDFRDFVIGFCESSSLISDYYIDESTRSAVYLHEVDGFIPFQICDLVKIEDPLLKESIGSDVNAYALVEYVDDGEEISLFLEDEAESKKGRLGRFVGRVKNSRVGKLAGKVKDSKAAKLAGKAVGKITGSTDENVIKTEHGPVKVGGSKQPDTPVVVTSKSFVDNKNKQGFIATKDEKAAESLKNTLSWFIMKKTKLPDNTKLFLTPVDYIKAGSKYLFSYAAGEGTDKDVKIAQKVQQIIKKNDLFKPLVNAVKTLEKKTEREAQTAKMWQWAPTDFKSSLPGKTMMKMVDNMSDRHSAELYVRRFAARWTKRGFKWLVPLITGLNVAGFLPGLSLGPIGPLISGLATILVSSAIVYFLNKYVLLIDVPYWRIVLLQLTLAGAAAALKGPLSSAYNFIKDFFGGDPEGAINDIKDEAKEAAEDIGSEAAESAAGGFASYSQDQQDRLKYLVNQVAHRDHNSQFNPYNTVDKIFAGKDMDGTDRRFLVKHINLLRDGRMNQAEFIKELDDNMRELNVSGEDLEKSFNEIEKDGALDFDDAAKAAELASSLGKSKENIAGHILGEAFKDGKIDEKKVAHLAKVLTAGIKDKKAQETIQKRIIYVITHLDKNATKDFKAYGKDFYNDLKNMGLGDVEIGIGFKEASKLNFVDTPSSLIHEMFLKDTKVYEFEDAVIHYDPSDKDTVGAMKKHVDKYYEFYNDFTKSYSKVAEGFKITMGAFGGLEGESQRAAFEEYLDKIKELRIVDSASYETVRENGDRIIELSKEFENSKFGSAAQRKIQEELDARLKAFEEHKNAIDGFVEERTRKLADKTKEELSNIVGNSENAAMVDPESSDGGYDYRVRSDLGKMNKRSTERYLKTVSDLAGGEDGEVSFEDIVKNRKARNDIVRAMKQKMEGSSGSPDRKAERLRQFFSDIGLSMEGTDNDYKIDGLLKNYASGKIKASEVVEEMAKYNIKLDPSKIDEFRKEAQAGTSTAFI